jgi:hypothetical protein
MKPFQRLFPPRKKRNILDTDLPAPAGSLELYNLLNAKELQEARWEFNKVMEEHLTRQVLRQHMEEESSRAASSA